MLSNTDGMMIMVALTFVVGGTWGLYNKLHSGGPIASREVRAVDGDTLAIRGEGYIRLVGIDAPERGQTCVPMDHRAPYDCGDKARYELQILVNRGEVRCVPHKHDVFQRILATCMVNGLDLSQEMIVRGLAITYGDWGHRYTSDERAAKASRLGIHSTFFDAPSVWRRANAHLGK